MSSITRNIQDQIPRSPEALLSSLEKSTLLPSNALSAQNLTVINKKCFYDHTQCKKYDSSEFIETVIKIDNIDKSVLVCPSHQPRDLESASSSNYVRLSNPPLF